MDSKSVSTFNDPTELMYLKGTYLKNSLIIFFFIYSLPLFQKVKYISHVTIQLYFIRGLLSLVLEL
jgi:hypothetical protein